MRNLGMETPVRGKICPHLPRPARRCAPKTVPTRGEMTRRGHVKEEKQAFQRGEDPSTLQVFQQLAEVSKNAVQAIPSHRTRGRTRIKVVGGAGIQSLLSPVPAGDRGGTLYTSRGWAQLPQPSSPTVGKRRRFVWYPRRYCDSTGHLENEPPRRKQPGITGQN